MFRKSPAPFLDWWEFWGHAYCGVIICKSAEGKEWAFFALNMSEWESDILFQLACSVERTCVNQVLEQTSSKKKKKNCDPLQPLATECYSFLDAEYTCGSPTLFCCYHNFAGFVFFCKRKRKAHDVNWVDRYVPFLIPLSKNHQSDANYCQ